VHWPSRLPGPDTEDSPESSRQDAQLKIKVPPDRPDEYPLETSRRDEEPTLEDPPGMSQRAARPKLKVPPDKLGAENHELEALKAAERRATADARLRWHHNNYKIAHETFNHRSSAVDAAIAAGVLKDAARPPGFSCPACAHVDPSGAHFVRNTKVDSSVPLVPYHHVELDLWGPFEVGDPLGFRYLFGGVDRATGKVFIQPIRKKSDAKEALRAYLALIRAQCPGIELHLRLSFKDIKVPGLAIVSHDRGG